MIKDEQIFELIQEEEKRQLQGLELIASENFVSNQVLEATGSVLTNKYAANLSGIITNASSVETIIKLALKNL